MIIHLKQSSDRLLMMMLNMKTGKINEYLLATWQPLRNCLHEGQIETHSNFLLYDLMQNEYACLRI